VRGDADRGLLWRLSVSQWSAALSVLLALLFLRRIAQRVARSS
jgi:hypothetical protein